MYLHLFRVKSQHQLLLHLDQQNLLAVIVSENILLMVVPLRRMEALLQEVL